MQLAAKRLADRSVKISAVASEVGYESEAHSAVFQEVRRQIAGPMEVRLLLSAWRCSASFGDVHQPG
jgi:hypothetical protein